MIKAIETKYKGYRFRSRTEARWAVFFDAMGVAWEYEKEGYDIDGKWYLPDFYLPKYSGGCFAEIKGQDFTFDEAFLCLRLSEETQKHCILLDGIPSAMRYPMCIWSMDHNRSIAGAICLSESKRSVEIARSARFEHGETGVSL